MQLHAGGQAALPCFTTALQSFISRDTRKCEIAQEGFPTLEHQSSPEQKLTAALMSHLSPGFQRVTGKGLLQHKVQLV